MLGKLSSEKERRHGRHGVRLAALLAVLVGALIVPAMASAAAKWLTYPTCTATSTTITCTGKVDGISRQFNYPEAAAVSALLFGSAFVLVMITERLVSKRTGVYTG